jgi:hypothetical protein
LIQEPLAPFDGLAAGLRALPRATDAFASTQAVSFANFVQDVLNLVPVPEAELDPEWVQRQRAFRRAALDYLPELQLEAMLNSVGANYTLAQGSHYCHGVRPEARNTNDRSGKILQELAPALRFQGDGSTERGSLLYLR